MRYAKRFMQAIERLEAEEAQGHTFGLDDSEYHAVRRVLRCRVNDIFSGGLAAHHRIVALGFAIAITTPGKGTS